MVDKLGSLSPLLLQIQQSRGTATAAAAALRSARAGTPASATTAAGGTLRERVMQRLAGVEADDPQRRRRAIRAFIEVRLLDEFGAALANEAGFQQLVDDVAQAMAAQPALHDDLEAAADLLLAAPP